MPPFLITFCYSFFYIPAANTFFPTITQLATELARGHPIIRWGSERRKNPRDICESRRTEGILDQMEGQLIGQGDGHQDIITKEAGGRWRGWGNNATMMRWQGYYVAAGWGPFSISQTRTSFSSLKGSSSFEEERVSLALQVVRLSSLGGSRSASGGWVPLLGPGNAGSLPALVSYLSHSRFLPHYDNCHFNVPKTASAGCPLNSCRVV